MLFSFLSTDRRCSDCLYEAPSPDMIIAAAKRAGIPADTVVEVDRISADMYAWHGQVPKPVVRTLNTSP